MDVGLEGKVVLITGSSRGLGRETALLFARQGARVVVNYRRNREGAEAVAGEIKSAGGQALPLQGDVSDLGSMRTLVEKVAEEWGGVDVLVNNAVAFVEEVPLEALTAQKWGQMLGVVLSGAFHCAYLCAPWMRQQKWRRIVNLTSYIALKGYAKMAHYAAAKSGLVGLTRSLAKELGPDGILVNAVAPQIIMTETMKSSLPAKVQERMARRNPLRRLATPEDIARVVLFLGSGWNTYVNGEVIVVNGGA